MAENKKTPNLCMVCGEAADIVFEGSSYFVTCLDCGLYEILELAAEHLQELSLDDRRRLLDNARSLAEIQGGPPLIREPFVLE